MNYPHLYYAVWNKSAAHLLLFMQSYSEICSVRCSTGNVFVGKRIIVRGLIGNKDLPKWDVNVGSSLPATGTRL